MNLVPVTLKSGKVINVLPREIVILRKAGLLKEFKTPSETKEFKDETQTKTAKEEKEARERMYPSKKRPINISSANIKGGRPKKVK
ncbi:MAG: hypothetical protein D4R45_04485 [Planctomycetaceae bacterium]|nr:MAG: hypothetical protein D4R45_04485 [Planctomycetaceae bacterium]